MPQTTVARKTSTEDSAPARWRDSADNSRAAVNQHYTSFHASFEWILSAGRSLGFQRLFHLRITTI